jgi:hypothetical protein
MNRIRQRGTGAHYSKEIKRLSNLDIEILQILKASGSKTKSQLLKTINRQREQDNRRYLTSGGLSGRLSELCGLKLVSMSKGRVEIWDPERMAFRWKTKPVWSITDEGREQLEKPDPRRLRRTPKTG